MSNAWCKFLSKYQMLFGEETTVTWVSPSFKEEKLLGAEWCEQLKFSVSVKTALPMPCVVDVNFKPFLPFLLFDFPLNESFQR